LEIFVTLDAASSAGPTPLPFADCSAGPTSVPLADVPARLADVPAEIVRLRAEAARLTAAATELLKSAAELEAGLNPGPQPTISGKSSLAEEMRHAQRTLCRSVERHNVTIFGVAYSIRKVIKDDYHVIKVIVASGKEADYQWNEPANQWEQITGELAAPKAATPAGTSDWRGLKHRLQNALGTGKA
jgi:hypothetical protein